MRISLGLPVSGAWATPASLARFAKLAEDLGYYELWAFQRLLVGAEQRIDAAYQSVLDPIVALSYASAITSRVRLGVAVINLPYLSPAYLAKQAASLDVLSGGRHDLGLGTGWSVPEFVATGSDPHPRGRRTEEYLSVLRTLFTDPEASFAGEFYTVPPSRFAPRPVQAGGPPVLLGGVADTALRRAGRIAAGWVSSSRTPIETVERGVRLVRQAAEEAGRDPDRVRVVVRGVVRVGERDDAMPLSGTAAQIRAGAARYAEAGVTELFYDLNWDPLIGGPEADAVAAPERAGEIITDLAPDGFAP